MTEFGAPMRIANKLARPDKTGQNRAKGTAKVKLSERFMDLQWSPETRAFNTLAAARQQPFRSFLSRRADGSQEYLLMEDGKIRAAVPDFASLQLRAMKLGFNAR